MPPKKKLRESRNDFRGGLNTAVSRDALHATELLKADDARLSTASIGAVEKRKGSRKMHQTVLTGSAAITGLFQWDNPITGKKQIVAISNGDLFYADVGASDFVYSWTQVDPTPAFSTTQNQTFAVFRKTASGAPLRLYIADGTVVYEFTGAALTQLDGTNSVPDCITVAAYHDRMFYGNLTQTGSITQKQIYWSKIGDPTDCSVSGPTDGGVATVDVRTGEAITAMEVTKESLLIATETSVSVFTGYSDDDIRIEQDTNGLSSDTGCVGPNALCRIEGAVLFLDKTGLYIGNEDGIQYLGGKVQPTLDAYNLSTTQSDSYVRYHAGRKEVWLFLDSDAGGNLDTIWVYSLINQAWMGPWSPQFTMKSATRYTTKAGAESLIVGGTDGFVYLMDTGYKDGVLYDESGGSTYNMDVRTAPIFFEPGPGWLVQLDRAAMQMTAAVNTNPAIALLDCNNGITVAGTLAISVTAEKFKTTSQLTFYIAEEVYTKAATDLLVFSAADTINTGTAAGSFWGVWLVQINASGTVSTVSPSSDQVYATEAAAINALPVPEGDNVPIGYITVQSNAGVAWTANTDDLTAASDCLLSYFYDFKLSNAFSTGTVTGAGAIPRNYRVDLNSQSSRSVLQVRDGSANAECILHGFILEAYDLMRPEE
jgi:hypothetical protein